MEPTRFLDGDEDAFEAQLLRSARHDAPPSGAALRAGAALGLAVGTASAAGGVAGTVAGGAARTSVGAAPMSAKLGLLGIGKWFGIGMVSGIVATAGVHYASVESAPHGAEKTTRPMLADEQGAVPSVPSTPALLDAPAQAVAAPETREAASATEAATTTARAPQRRPRAAPSAETAASPSAAATANGHDRLASLSAELAILERARGALLAHDPAGVLAALAEYASAPRSGVLDSEADVLHVEALAQAGRTADAVALAERGLRAAPAGPHAALFRQIIQGEPAKP
jgi:hypothetical protein